MTTLTTQITTFVTNTMSQQDPSHNPEHVHRVVQLAKHIFTHEKARSNKPLDENVIHLAALLHDIEDRKYQNSVARAVQGQGMADGEGLVYSVLVSYGAESELAERVQTIVSHVSYTTEREKPETVRGLIEGRFPELAVVQDADRLDAIGAVGIGRCFTFLGAKGREFCEGGRWVMGNAIEHFEEKLERLEGMMKTETGREMARVRTARLKEFRAWWAEEMNEAA
ncbi:hypothetical protein BDV28DRAFT_148462 [Aspergillus coremiiformis]|uniref:HD/PDEase domain-containing protein n=1 Tax=Aspergillus coremiiformis TaxID=138285 RepID=A0A5N6Z6I8_9EURO|nr:hypothetical protein BDV28DRAFT_148462 [Aspergillus coremiiformis]